MRRRGTAYLVFGAVATVVAVLLLVLGETGPLTWTALGAGPAGLLIGAAQLSSARGRQEEQAR